MCKFIGGRWLNSNQYIACEAKRRRMNEWKKQRVVWRAQKLHRTGEFGIFSVCTTNNNQNSRTTCQYTQDFPSFSGYHHMYSAHKQYTSSSHVSYFLLSTYTHEHTNTHRFTLGRSYFFRVSLYEVCHLSLSVLSVFCTHTQTWTEPPPPQPNQIKPDVRHNLYSLRACSSDPKQCNRIERSVTQCTSN